MRHAATQAWHRVHFARLMTIPHLAMGTSPLRKRPNSYHDSTDTPSNINITRNGILLTLHSEFA